MTDATVNAALLSADLPCVPCGLNADWSVSAWYFGTGKPNIDSVPSLYLLDEEYLLSCGSGAFSVVSRVGFGDDTQTDFVKLGTLAECVAYLRSEYGIA